MASPQAASPPSIGIIGLGAMGGPIAERLVAAGYHVLGHDTDVGRITTFVERGGVAGQSAGRVACAAAVVLTVLPSADALLAVCSEIAGALGGVDGGAGHVDLVELSTLGLDTKRTAAATLENAGVAVIDGALSGTAVQAMTGDLVVYASGNDDVFARCEGPLRAMSRSVHFLGCFGTATVTKLVANLLVSTHIAAAAEALAMARLAGLEPVSTLAALTDGTGTSRMLEIRGPMMVQESYLPASMRLELFLKDVGLIESLAREVGAPVPLFTAAADIFRSAAADGLGAMDTAVIHTWLARAAGAGSADEPGP